LIQPSAICERQELPVHSTRTRFFRPSPDIATSGQDRIIGSG
jgi:hypothetical protein